MKENAQFDIPLGRYLNIQSVYFVDEFISF